MNGFLWVNIYCFFLFLSRSFSIEILVAGMQRVALRVHSRMLALQHTFSIKFPASSTKSRCFLIVFPVWDAAVCIPKKAYLAIHFMDRWTTHIKTKPLTGEGIPLFRPFTITWEYMLAYMRHFQPHLHSIET